ncbi:hypothetical protein J3Q64DRAFT_1738854 [Phycomyces blakesleeanus]|uniref:Uncharacterized protein n=1 Tax=Phycomyces blakesleeanus TaxID=4837 RepID=A0ABR3AZB5_PHYBL
MRQNIGDRFHMVVTLENGLNRHPNQLCDTLGNHGSHVFPGIRSQALICRQTIGKQMNLFLAGFHSLLFMLHLLCLLILSACLHPRLPLLGSHPIQSFISSFELLCYLYSYIHTPNQAILYIILYLPISSYSHISMLFIYI